MIDPDTVCQQMGSVPGPDGLPVKTAYLSNKSGMSICFMDYGATWFSCLLPVQGQVRDVLLGSPQIKSFLNQGAYFGPIVGRYANRIRHSQFCLKAQSYQLQANEGKHSLHGGPNGFEQRRWVLEKRSDTLVRMTLDSPNLDQGYPGALKIVVDYHLTQDNRVIIDYHAISDELTYLNLTNHAYFNLLGENTMESVLGHRLQMNADRYLPTDSELIPTGLFKKVEGTSFDFRQPKKIGEDLLQDDDQQLAKGYDHAFLFSPQRKPLEPVAKLFAPDDSVQLSLFTTKPAIQLYGGQGLSGVAGKSGEYDQYAGLALETQFLPDGPNHPEWEGLNGLLAAGVPYQHRTEYLFEYIGSL